MHLLYLIELAWLFIDSISGYFINHHINLPMGQTIGSMFRMAVSFFILWFVIKNHSIDFLAKTVFYVLLFVVCLNIVHLYLYGEIYIIHGLQYSLKVILPFLLFVATKVQVESGFLNRERITKIIIVNYTVLVTNVFLGVLGIGFSKYGHGEGGFIEGGKGFFFSGNELSGTFLALYSLMLIWSLRRNMTINVTVITLSFIVSILLFSKTTFAGYILVTIFYLLFVLKNLKILFSILIFSPLIAILTFDYWIEFLLRAFERWEFFLSVGTSFSDGLTSGRTRRLAMFYELLNKDTIFLIFGYGGYYKEVLSVELDFFDLLIRFGIFSTFVVYGFWLYLCASNFIYYIKRHTQGSLMASFTIFLLISVGFSAGHVMYSAMLAPFPALLALSGPNFSRKRTSTLYLGKYY